MKKQKLLVVGNNASLVVCDDIQLKVMAVSKDKKTVICGDKKTGTVYSNNAEAAKAFVKEDAEAGEFPAMLVHLAIELGGLEEVELDEKSVL